MTETEWKLRKELADTKLALYGAQNAYLQQAATTVQNELRELGAEWKPQDETPS